MKRVICAGDIEKLAKDGGKTFYADEDSIITPSAVDAAKTAGIEIAHGKPECCESKSDTASCGDGISSDVIYEALKSMAGKGLLNDVTEETSEKPYSAETHASGIKLVRGDSVEMEFLETGTPGVKACYQEVIGSDDGCHMGSGFLEIDSSKFEWVLEGYEELDYVIEGSVNIIVDGQTFTAHKGDVFFLPNNAKVVWESPDKARIFYATYPAS